jgi:hypothetical protein
MKMVESIECSSLLHLAHGTCRHGFHETMWRGSDSRARLVDERLRAAYKLLSDDEVASYQAMAMVRRDFDQAFYSKYPQYSHDGAPQPPSTGTPASNFETSLGDNSQAAPDSIFETSLDGDLQAVATCNLGPSLDGSPPATSAGNFTLSLDGALQATPAGNFGPSLDGTPQATAAGIFIPSVDGALQATPASNFGSSLDGEVHAAKAGDIEYGAGVGISSTTSHAPTWHSFFEISQDDSQQPTFEGTCHDGKQHAQTTCFFENNLDGNSWGGTRHLFATSPNGNRPATLDGTLDSSLDGDQQAEHGHSSSGDLSAAAAPFLPHDLAAEPFFPDDVDFVSQLANIARQHLQWVESTRPQIVRSNGSFATTAT